MGFRGGMMAKMTIKGTDELALQLSKLGNMSTKIAKDVVMAGAQPVADEIRASIYYSLPDDTLRILRQGEKFDGVQSGEKQDLLDSLGITPPDIDNAGNANVKVGFDGYGSYETDAYPAGVPIPLLARAIESGSSIRQKNPFIRQAVNRSKKKALEEMQKKCDEEIKIIFE